MPMKKLHSQKKAEKSLSENYTVNKIKLTGSPSKKKFKNCELKL